MESNIYIATDIILFMISIKSGSIIFFIKDRTIGLRSFADWAFGSPFNPFCNAFFMVDVFAFEFDQFFILFEFTVANRANVFLIFLFFLVASWIFYPF